MKAATSEFVATLLLSAISIHAAREGGDAVLVNVHACDDISIHAAREGGDVNVSVCKVFAKISIHAAREGGDQHWLFLPSVELEFQSTPPVKAATFTCACLCKLFKISIHAAREGGDP